MSSEIIVNFTEYIEKQWQTTMYDSEYVDQEYKKFINMDKEEIYKIANKIGNLSEIEECEANIKNVYKKINLIKENLYVDKISSGESRLRPEASGSGTS